MTWKPRIYWMRNQTTADAVPPSRATSQRQRRHGTSTQAPRPFSFPWGGGQIVEEVFVESEHHVPTIQLLEYEDGSLSVRFCSYTHTGVSSATRS